MRPASPSVPLPPPSDEASVIRRKSWQQRVRVSDRVQTCWAGIRIKVARMTATIKLDGNWNRSQLANSAPPLSGTDSTISPSARMSACLERIACHPQFVDKTVSQGTQTPIGLALTSDFSSVARSALWAREGVGVGGRLQKFIASSRRLLGHSVGFGIGT